MGSIEIPHSSLTSDVKYNLTSFDPLRTSQSTRQLNNSLLQAAENDSKWWEVRHQVSSLNNETILLYLESKYDIPLLDRAHSCVHDQVGPAVYRQMRAEGKTAFPPYTQLPRAAHFDIPSSSEPGRSIQCRVFKPSGDNVPRGILLHIHGGGYVLGTAAG